MLPIRGVNGAYISFSVEVIRDSLSVDTIFFSKLSASR